MYVYSEDKGQTCSINGHYAEDLFVESYYKNYGIKPIKTSVNDDRYNHQDYSFIMNGQKYTCDVKYPKKISRQDNNFSKEYLWVEFMTKGFPGWLYGHQDYLAFLMPDLKTFKMVKREELLNLCCDIVNYTNFVNNTNDALYNMYRRSNRFGYKDDMLSLIKYEDLDKCSSNFIIATS